MLIEPLAFSFSPRQLILIRNSTSRPQSFKVKANRQALTAKPSHSILQPGQSIDIELSLAGEWQRESKYLVSWVEGCEIASSTQLWKTANSKIIEVLAPPPKERSVSAELSSEEKEEALQRLVQNNIIRRASSESSSASHSVHMSPRSKQMLSEIASGFKELRTEREAMAESIDRLSLRIGELIKKQEAEEWNYEKLIVLSMVFLAVGVALSRLSIL